jgi:hypothetical protein
MIFWVDGDVISLLASTLSASPDCRLPTRLPKDFRLLNYLKMTTMKSLLRLAVLINLVHLSTGLVGLGSFTSRILRPLNNSSSSDDENQSASSSSSPSSAERKDNANAFESIVRKVSGNDEYKFGDLSKSVISSSTKGVEGVVKSVTKNEDYEFGDYTKTALGATTSGFENVVRSVIKNEECKLLPII